MFHYVFLVCVLLWDNAFWMNQLLADNCVIEMFWNEYLMRRVFVQQNGCKGCNVIHTYFQYPVATMVKASLCVFPEWLKTVSPVNMANKSCCGQTTPAYALFQ